VSALILLRPHSPSTRLVSSSGQQSTTHLVVGNVSTSTWFSDTGANQQFAPDLATLTESSPYLVNHHLYVGDGCCNPFLGPHKIYIKIYSQRRLEK